MKDVERAQDLIGVPVFDRTGDRIGRVGNVYVADDTHEPEWVTVRIGLLRQRETFVPLDGANAAEDRVDVQVSRDSVRSAPQVSVKHGHLSDSAGRGLFRHYGLGEVPEQAGPQNS